MYIGGIAGPILLIMIGAILRWAVTERVQGFDIQLTGLIIFIVGVILLALSIILWALGRGPWVRHERVTHDYVDDDRDLHL